MGQGKRTQLLGLRRCEINYLTFAEQQICYEYEVKITDTPSVREINGEKKQYYNFKTEIIKDGYKILEKITLHDDLKPSIIRNLQDYAQYTDRVAYRNEKYGREQAKGLINELTHQFGHPSEFFIPVGKAIINNDTKGENPQ